MILSTFFRTLDAHDIIMALDNFYKKPWDLASFIINMPKRSSVCKPQLEKVCITLLAV